MCRFVLYFGASITLDMLTTKPKHSLIHQSYDAREREEPLNGDGFGIAWYVPEYGPEPTLYRSTSPAWSNANLRQLARVTRSHCIFAHVRAATPPLPVIELNCHPFTHKQITLMHNGYIPEFAKVRRSLLQCLSDEAFQTIHGSTDSEYILALYIDQWNKQPARDTVKGMADALQATIHNIEAVLHTHHIDEAARLNVALTDGERVVVSRYSGHEPDAADSLYYHQGKAYIIDDGECRMVEPDLAKEAVLVASEPLSSDPGWDKVPVNHLVLIDKDQNLQLRACAPAN